MLCHFKKSTFVVNPLEHTGPDLAPSGGMAKKPLTVEEKRRRALEYLMEKRDFFMLRELEKALPKEKGIVSQTVADVIKSLVDDNLVQCERIGQSNYIYAFPSAAVKTRNARLAALRGEAARLAAQTAELEAREQAALPARAPGAERDALLAELAGLEARRVELSSALDALRDMDPVLLAARGREADGARAACDRWTDNVFALQSYVTSTFGVSRSDFCAQFEVPEDFDYVAEPKA